MGGGEECTMTRGGCWSIIVIVGWIGCGDDDGSATAASECTNVILEC